MHYVFEVGTHITYYQVIIKQILFKSINLIFPKKVLIKKSLHFMNYNL